MTVINESGLYTLVIRSNKPEAKKFRKWVTSEVLPQIRKTGSYNSSSSTSTINAHNAPENWDKLCDKDKEIFQTNINLIADKNEKITLLDTSNNEVLISIVDVIAHFCCSSSSSSSVISKLLTFLANLPRMILPLLSDLTFLNRGIVSRWENRLFLNF